jgi:hypothetical protein
VRSKSELIIADKLAEADLDYVYEKPLTLGGQTKFPDFTIEDDESGITYFWEHCGMLHDPDYGARWTRKQEWYRANDIRPAEEGGGQAGTLIVTADNEAGGISSPEITRIIEHIILA